MSTRPILLASLVLFVLMNSAADAQAPVGYDDTPMQPNGTWRVHDGRRPQPPVVTPRVTNDAPVPAPSDATVLFGSGDDLSAWRMPMDQRRRG